MGRKRGREFMKPVVMLAICVCASVGVGTICQNRSLASQPLFLRGGARGGGREKESGDLSQHFVFSAGMWVEPMRLQQSHDLHSVIQRDSACDCHRCKAQLGYPRLCPKQELAVKNSFSGRDVLVSLLTGTGKSPCYYVYILLKAFPWLTFQRLLLSEKGAVLAEYTLYTIYT